MASSDDDYLNNKVRHILEPLVTSVMSEQPNDIFLYMFQYLQKLQGKHVNVSNMEKEELKNLRKEIRKYKNLHEEKEDALSKKSSESEEEDDKVEEMINKRKNNMAISKQRIGVSAEAYGKFNKKEEFVARIIKKTDEQKKRIMDRILISFLFNSLDEKDVNTVIDAMEEKRVKAGTNVITEGEKGDVLYLIESGNLECFKTFKKEEGPKYLKTYNPGEAFGELALLYNAPRAATIKAKTDSILWALDRETFNYIVKAAAMKKREKYEEFLKTVEILSTMDSYELSQVCDVLNVEKIKKGDIIIKENDIGDKFYILEDGQAYAQKITKEGGKPEIVKEYFKGTYFGELALIRNEPRAATIIAKTDCKLLTIDRSSFKRILGPLENILKRNSNTYVKYFQK